MDLQGFCTALVYSTKTLEKYLKDGITFISTDLQPYSATTSAILKFQQDPLWTQTLSELKSKLKKKVIGFIMWFLRSHSESYQAAAFLLLTFDRIWIYYSSVYHYWYGVWFTFLVPGLVLNQVHKLTRPKKP